jgi:RHS repeat-associated protein
MPRAYEFDDATNRTTVHTAGPDGDTCPAARSSATRAWTYDETLRDTSTIGQRRYGWLGTKQRAADTPGGLILMDVRLYNPTTGRFLQTDPIKGGNANPTNTAAATPSIAMTSMAAGASRSSSRRRGDWPGNTSTTSLWHKAARSWRSRLESQGYTCRRQKACENDYTHLRWWRGSESGKIHFGGRWPRR